MCQARRGSNQFPGERHIACKKARKFNQTALEVGAIKGFVRVKARLGASIKPAAGSVSRRTL
jgi:hypothetical protein